MSEKLSLRWDDFQDNTQKAFGNLREGSDFVDVTLVCEDGQQVEAHKVILAASSPFFQNVLSRNKHPHPLVYMRGVKFDILLVIVDFLYYGEANLQQENLESFLGLAEELQLKGLLEKDEENVPDIDTKAHSPTQAVKLGKALLEKKISDIKKSPAKKEKTIAASSEIFNAHHLISRGLDQLEDQVKLLMEKGQNQIGIQKAYVCKVCGKEGYSSSIKDHIERNHIEGITVSCNQCEKSFRSRHSLRIHHQRNHNNYIFEKIKN